ncbi:glycolate oxidase iron-sulfur subunit [Vitreoscilla filiformis]|uniref:Glycolate oxidase iron-sulfur subunit n=1 Tax=Vitreoscilla filiformis TaxID=63 RepID=A0A221KEB7_VITFI|nr:glycolate oxidase subunit GlcF [Vitreoscilla filiformis]ASM77170.1 glycolate oxidase iron-sulfur subunit [Vitreoscilla filiformis]
MQTHLAPEFAGTPEGEAAEAILRKCVHCGFCTATCPTYQLLGDELDSPRGRIYLIKQMLEGAPVTSTTQTHLDRCLTCRNCETTCPSGVQYGQLVDIGRRLVEAKVPRSNKERTVRWLLKEGLTSKAFKPAMTVGRSVRSLLPEALRDKVPAQAEKVPAQRWPQRAHARKVLMLAGCVQPTLMPNINVATARVLDAAGIQTVIAASAGCCGALRSHLADHEGGLADMRRNIDAWWPHIEAASGAAVEAIVMNASACGVTVKEYGLHLAHDARYADKARRVSELARDVSELLPDVVAVLGPLLATARDEDDEPIPLAYHPPCTLQHGQKLRGQVEKHLGELGFAVRTAPVDAHLCCGSAGTYSVLQPELAGQLRDRKLASLQDVPGAVLVSANIGCIQHLQGGSGRPVKHWIEVLDEAVSAALKR